jgi:uncharacterized membrane protein SpoIIM required for sporulation
MTIVVVLLLRVGNSIFNREELLGRTIDQLNLKGTLRKIGRYLVAVDDAGTPARSILDWYRRGLALSLRHLGWAPAVTMLVFLLALIGGAVIGRLPDWQLELPRGLSLAEVTRDFDSSLGVFFGAQPVMAIIWQNGRILLLALVLGMFTFGSLALIITPAVYVILGYLFTQVAVAGYDSSFLLPAVLTHGVVEIPVIVLATAAALHLGAVITRPPRGVTVGHAWVVAFADTIKIAVGILIPGLVAAALIEVYITPLVVKAVLGG